MAQTMRIFDGRRNRVYGNTPGASGVLPTGAAEFFKRRLAEILGITLFCTALLLTLALLSYTPGDPSLNSAGGHDPGNFLGQSGALTADFALQSFGLAGTLLLLTLAAWGWRIRCRRNGRGIGSVPHNKTFPSKATSSNICPNLMGFYMDLQFLKQPGSGVWVARAVDWVNQSGGHLNIGISNKAINARAQRGQTHLLGQMYGVVGPGMIRAKHVFKGLKRKMMVRDDANAETTKLAVTWSASRDAVLEGDHKNYYLRYMGAPPGRVFVVYVTPNEMLIDYPDIYAWAEHWTWLPADPELPDTPIDWETRYDSRVWSSE